MRFYRNRFLRPKMLNEAMRIRDGRRSCNVIGRTRFGSASAPDSAMHLFRRRALMLRFRNSAGARSSANKKHPKQGFSERVFSHFMLI
jgi:hypothetical protein